ncbi:MAG: TetR/AcrR family transcriptional regulator [Ilumatobacteraceae bacterium]|nr:TetR/AcrR family transcriptional regulator [Ilumatobacteraceae bacterium]
MLILDAAEKVFGRDGIHDGSLRNIATQSGFSTAGIYLFFENKQHLLAETLSRRGTELTTAIAHVASLLSRSCTRSSM